MNGTKPEFLSEVPENYYSKPDPYKLPESCNVNLLELSRYAKSAGKKITELTAEEVAKFKIAAA